jgi:hypothetical protein
MQIDLSKFRGGIPAARLVEGGTLLGEVDHECMAHEAPLGNITTGVGGLTGGGFGRLVIRHVDRQPGICRSGDGRRTACDTPAPRRIRPVLGGAEAAATGTS